jgi:hypothetical protein
MQYFIVDRFWYMVRLGYLYFKQYKQYNVLIYTFYMSVSMSKSKENPNKDRKTFIACFKEQIDYFVNSFSDLSPYKKNRLGMLHSKPCFFKQKTRTVNPYFEDEDGVEYDSFTYDLIVLNSLKESRNENPQRHRRLFITVYYP